MEKIISITSGSYETTYGVLEEDVHKAKGKDFIKSIIDNGGITCSTINDDGDQVDNEKIVINNYEYFGITLGLNSLNLYKLIEKSQDPEEDQVLYTLQDSFDYKGWLVGRFVKSISGLKVGATEIIAVQKDAVTELELNEDNYINSSLSWIFDALLTDYSEKYGTTEDDVEFDDGE